MHHANERHAHEATPEQLFEMTKSGVSEETVQHIFDALIHAEENGFRFVNVYQGDEITFRCLPGR
jgi:hypothetical protein